MKLYGTTTSPFTRRVRIVAAEVGEPVERIDTATDEGMAQLRAVSPIRKVPVVVIDGRTLFDSRAIIAWLVMTRGYKTIAPPRDHWREQNLINAVDAAIDSVIQLFYLRRDKVEVTGTPFDVRQRERTGAILAWLATELTDARAFGLPEISLICALDWMDFRDAFPTAGLFTELRAALRERASLASTRPHA
jgi:glutathione S-transferase